jgi:nitrite reductase (cytochrome c-552)
MRNIRDIVHEKPWVGWVLFIGTLIIVFLIGLLGASIIERRSEANLAFQMVRPIDQYESRNEVWGESFPRQFETYRATLDTTFRSRHGGSATVDMLERRPDLVILWAGYAFAKGYNQGRGHYHAIEDVRNSLRTAQPQPATCWTCKSPDVPRMMNKMGVANFYRAGWADLGPEMNNPIGCADCHDSQNMNLIITRPALVEAFQRQGRDVRNATHQQMRSLVCAQCHVEYYFKGKEERYLTFPWDKGIVAEEVEAYYDSVGHVDFVHDLSRAPIIKAQHPDWELAQFGIHAERGVSCADCHMPYRSEGGVKFTNHKIQSPLADISASCQVCHRESEETLRKNVYDRQDKLNELMLTAEHILVKAHIEARTAWDNGATEDEMSQILTLIRHAQWRWDYVAASHGASFHAPIESARLLGSAIQKSEEARGFLAAVLTRRGVSLPVRIPDLSTKEKAQQYIGYDLVEASKQKERWLEEELPKWDRETKSE